MRHNVHVPSAGNPLDAVRLYTLGWSTVGSHLSEQYGTRGCSDNWKVCLSNHRIKICQNCLLAYICMVIPYQTTKFKPANTFCNSNLVPNRQILIPTNISSYIVCSLGSYKSYSFTITFSFQAFGGWYWQPRAVVSQGAARFRGNAIVPSKYSFRFHTSLKRLLV